LENLMRGELVAIDLETTGLDPQKDAIIEVGAVRMKDGEIVAEYGTMVNPDSPIPAHTTHITGIQQQDVANAPFIGAVLPEIAAFSQGAPIIAHNATLDIGFLRDRHHILQSNAVIDTYDLASVLIPRAPRYNLNSLTHQVGIDLENAHRALDDARATALLYWELWEKVLSLPHGLLREISTAARGMNWGSSVVFDAALQIVAHDDSQSYTTTFAPLEGPTTQQSRTPEPMSPESIDSILGESGIFASTMPDFEFRTQQLDMAHAIAESFTHSRHLMVEAGTGTGKSLAYLIPAVLWAVSQQQRVVISTNTLNLQDQLITKDIPALQNMLDVDFSAAVMKGRGNYLCPRRLAAARRRRPTSITELMVLAKILVWLQENHSGDKGEINLRGPAEHAVWSRLSAQDEDCTLHQCQASMAGICPFFKARKTAETADVLVVNHALLISDADADNHVIPDYSYLVVDEAHHLEDAVTNGLSLRIDRAGLQRRLADIGGANRGLLGEILKNVRGTAPDKDVMKLEQFVAIVSEATTLMEAHLKKFFEQVYKFLDDIHPQRTTEYVSLVRIEEQHRTRSSFIHMQNSWKPLIEFFEVIGAAVHRLTRVLNKMAKYNITDLEDLVTGTESAARYLAETSQHLTHFVQEPDPNIIYWISMGQGTDTPVINMAPLHVGPLVEKYLWQQKESVILTSATLKTHNNFHYLRERLYAEEVNTLEVGSPFDYAASTLVYIPNNIPEPVDRNGYQRAVERGIIELADALQGGLLVLFTSYSQLRQTSQAITPRLALGNITVYDQSDGTSRQMLLEGFKNTEKAVLLGTRSFWEGVDIPGSDLSALVIVRLPFAVPSDPVFAARSDTYKNAFGDYALPDAILRFRQGFGRLIRTRADRGVVTIFDSRVLTKGYGSSFLEALPDCTMQKGPLDDLPGAAVHWLDREG